MVKQVINVLKDCYLVETVWVIERATQNYFIGKITSKTRFGFQENFPHVLR